VSFSVDSCLRTYFVGNDQQLYESLSSSLAQYVRSLIESPDCLFNRELIKQILFLGNRAPSEWKSLNDRFFVQLISEMPKDAGRHLNTLSQIYERGWERVFFCAIDTKRNAFYSFETLGSLFSLFDELLHSVDPSLPPPDTCPAYGEGGERYLKEIRDSPAILLGRQEERETSVSRASFWEALFSGPPAFSQVKASAIRYISSFSGENRGPIEFYLRTFRFLSQNPRMCDIHEVGRVALVRLIVLMTTSEEGSVQQVVSFAEWEQMIEEIVGLHDRWGVEALDSFCRGIIVSSERSLDDVMRALSLFRTAAKKRGDIGKTLSCLEGFECKKYSLSVLIENLEAFVSVSDTSHIIREKDIGTVLKRFSGDDAFVRFTLSREHLSTIERQYGVVQKYCEEWGELRLGQLVEKALALSSKAQKQPLVEEEILQLVAIGRLALYIKTGCYLYNTQVLTVLGQLCHEKGVIAQVKTGEGKSLIISLLGFICVMQKKSLHIVSSSHYLAKRDRDEAARFFEAFGVKTSHICDHFSQADCFDADILYGTASDFEFAIMREMLYFSPLFVQKRQLGVRFDCVIVDELDNLTIDTAMSSARLSQPAEVAYEWIYRPILTFVRRLDRSDASTPREKVSELRDFLRGQIAEGLVSSLSKISDEQLEGWIKHAFSALYEMEENKNYIIKRDRETKRKEVLIVDAENTGRIMHGSRWGGGLHELVEVKHGIEPRKESLVPIALAHALYYPMYRSVFGLTGTVGGQQEREEIKQIYNIGSFDVPTYRPSQRVDLPTTVFATNSEYFTAIVERTNRYRSQERALLVVCRTIHDSQVLEKLFNEKGIPFEMLNEVQEKSEDLIVAKAGAPGAVTIATNTAGRGTDIKLERCCKEQGGLHVLITFDPESLRVEDQMRGRASRQGEPGSSEIVLSAEMLQARGDNTPQEIHFSEILSRMRSFQANEAAGPLYRQKNIPGCLTANTSRPSVQWTSCNITETLRQQRESRARIMKATHICRADIERCYFSFVASFYKALHEFNEGVSSMSFLDSRSEQLSHRKLLKVEERDESVMPKEEVCIAQEAIELLTRGENEAVRWRMLLVQIGRRIQKRAVVQWSTQVHHEYEKAVSGSSLEKISVELDERRRRIISAVMAGSVIEAAFFGVFEQEAERRYIEEASLLRQKINALYDAQRAAMEKYLDPSGNGIIEYLREITGAKLSGL